MRKSIGRILLSGGLVALLNVGCESAMQQLNQTHSEPGAEAAFAGAGLKMWGAGTGNLPAIEGGDTLANYGVAQAGQSQVNVYVNQPQTVQTFDNENERRLRAIAAKTGKSFEEGSRESGSNPYPSQPVRTQYNAPVSSAQKVERRRSYAFRFYEFDPNSNAFSLDRMKGEGTTFSTESDKQIGFVTAFDNQRGSTATISLYSDCMRTIERTSKITNDDTVRVYFFQMEELLDAGLNEEKLNVTFTLIDAAGNYKFHDGLLLRIVGPKKGPDNRNR